MPFPKQANTVTFTKTTLTNIIFDLLSCDFPGILEKEECVAGTPLGLHGVSGGLFLSMIRFFSFVKRLGVFFCVI